MKLSDGLTLAEALALFRRYFPDSKVVAIRCGWCGAAEVCSDCPEQRARWARAMEKE